MAQQVQRWLEITASPFAHEAEGLNRSGPGPTSSSATATASGTRSTCSSSAGDACTWSSSSTTPAGVVDDGYVATLATAITGSLGGRVGVAPRVFLKKLVGEVLDRVDQFADFDPRRHYALTLTAVELSEVERNAAPLAPRAATGPADIDLGLG